MKEIIQNPIYKPDISSDWCVMDMIVLITKNIAINYINSNLLAR